VKKPVKDMFAMFEGIPLEIFKKRSLEQACRDVKKLVAEVTLEE